MSDRSIQYGKYVDNRDGCCTGFSMSFIVVVNVLTCLLGLGIAGGAGYMYVQYSTFQQLLSELYIIAGMIVGVCIAILSCIGMMGATRHSRTQLGFYLFFMIIILLAQVVSSVIFLEYLGLIENVVGEGSDAEKLTESAEIQINNFMLSTYETCCYENSEFCSKLPSEVNYCMPVVACESDVDRNTTACYQGLHQNDTTPPVPIENGICEALKLVKVDGYPLVGNSRVENSCGGGNGKLYQQYL